MIKNKDEIKALRKELKESGLTLEKLDMKINGRLAYGIFNAMGIRVSGIMTIGQCADNSRSGALIDVIYGVNK